MIAQDTPTSTEADDIRQAVVDEVISELAALWANPFNVMHIRDSKTEATVRSTLTVAAEAVRKVGERE